MRLLSTVSSSFVAALLLPSPPATPRAPPVVATATLVAPGVLDSTELAAPDVMVFKSLPAPLERVLVGVDELALAEHRNAVQYLVEKRVVEEDACALLGACGLDGGEQLSLTLCGDESIRGLNCKWRAVDAPTDVLSFPMDDEQLLGDLVISLDTARVQAEERQHSLRDEMRILMVHGVLLLLGYEHESSAADYAEMAEATRKLLGRLGWVGEGLIEFDA